MLSQVIKVLKYVYKEYIYCDVFYYQNIRLRQERQHLSVFKPMCHFRCTQIGCTRIVVYYSSINLHRLAHFRLFEEALEALNKWRVHHLFSRQHTLQDS